MSHSYAEKDFHEVFRELRKNGACKICSLRFLCNAELSFLSSDFLESEGYENIVTDGIKVKKDNFCVICIGLFDEKTAEEARKRIVQEVERCEYDCTSYMLALIIPVSCKLREHSTYLFLRTKFPDLYRECPYSPKLGLKDSWRFVNSTSISKALCKTLDTKSEMSIQIEFVYDNDQKDFQPIAPVVKEHAKKNKMELSCCMKLMNNPDFYKLFPFPMTVPSESVVVKSISIKRNSIFMAGRYNKYSRELSQTPWILSDGERKMDLSVEEIISNKLKELLKANDSKFSSSGREDVDVRTLGNGRPFAVELLLPRKSQVLQHDIRRVENEINELGSKLVFVRDLQIVNRSQLIALKQGEESKTKNYCCLCIMKKEVTREFLASRIPSTPFDIQQKTPIRVLHRRTLSTRSRTIFDCTIEKLEQESQRIAGCTIFKLNLKTAAGTYIKEFVNGDFGRTQPNISALMGNLPVNVLALDVTNVGIDWPTAVKYD